MNSCVRLLLPCLVAGLLAACGGAPDSEGEAAIPSALVKTQMPAQGALPETVLAYGVAAASVDASLTMTLPVQGAFGHLDVMVGQRVARGQSLGNFVPSGASVTALLQARSALTLAVTQRDHVASLLASQLATRDQLAQADKAVADAKAALAGLPAVDGSGDVVLHAPFDGVVTAVGAPVGETLAPGATLVTLARNDRLTVVTGVEPAVMTRIEAQDKATLTPVDGGAVVSASVRRGAGALDPRSHQAPVELVPEGAITAGMSYRAQITVGQWKGWLVPRDALLDDATGLHVMQVAEGKAVRVPVTLVGEQGDTSAVSGALDATHPLVVVGAGQLDEGMQVRPDGAAR
ncbi:RND family efflux transporter MFP subunit [Luteibacter sp. Sphag1AF]|uniref:efflux RND transporter periplasmic adaptor subunit n=1 Tax=Luteibacter sp. Sphag1AF TaxID=2587031 RepID=UPI00160E0442|nr:efflux RND transporter periplasmic adaptor subunit [Luteibacter sp. Sphag1AF]MBB3227360.1 RND family efflux transporter MFP subunit [Luteibacter sp. Sphag1AF]